MTGPRAHGTSTTTQYTERVERLGTTSRLVIFWFCDLRQVI